MVSLLPALRQAPPARWRHCRRLAPAFPPLQAAQPFVLLAAPFGTPSQPGQLAAGATLYADVLQVVRQHSLA